MARHGKAGSGLVGCGKARQAWQGEERPVMARNGPARYGEARHGRHGRRGEAWSVKVWFGVARRGSVRHDEAGI